MRIDFQQCLKAILTALGLLLVSLQIASSDPLLENPAWTNESDPALTETEFWAIIAKLNLENPSNEEQVVEPVRAILARLSGDEIVAFHEYLSRALYLLDTHAHFKASHTTSDDTFLYARMAVLSMGQKKFAMVLKRPRKFPKGVWFEGFFGLADIAYEAATGNQFPDSASVSYESGSNARGWGN